MEKKQEVYALEVLRETLQRFYDVVYPFDEAIGCRDLPALAPNDIDSLRFSMDDFTDATPDFRNVCDVAVQLLKMSDREELRRRLAELKGAIVDFGRAHTAMIGAGKTEYAARCGEANAAYERIRDLTEAVLCAVDGLLTSGGGEQAAATPSVTFEQEAQGVTKRVIVNGVTDAAKAQEQAAQAFANMNVPQGGAQVAPQIATQGKKPDVKFPMGDGAEELYKAGMEWLARPCNKGKSAHDAVYWLVTDCQRHRKFRVRIRTKGQKPLDAETAGFVADTVDWKWDDPDVVAWGRHLSRYMKWCRDEEARSIAANQSATALPPPPLQIESKPPIRNKKTLKRVGKRRGK
jgi:hypothetical protein